MPGNTRQEARRVHPQPETDGINTRKPLAKINLSSFRKPLKMELTRPQRSLKPNFHRLRPDLVVEQELAAVEQHPENVGKSVLAVD